MNETTRSNESSANGQVADVGDPRLHLIVDAAVAGGFGVRSSIVWAMSAATYVTPWPGAQPAQRDPAAARDVQHPRAGGLPADLLGRGVQPAQVALHPDPPHRTAHPWVLDGPVVEARPQRVVAPAAESGEPHAGSSRRGRRPSGGSPRRGSRRWDGVAGHAQPVVCVGDLHHVAALSPQPAAMSASHAWSASPQTSSCVRDAPRSRRPARRRRAAASARSRRGPARPPTAQLGCRATCRRRPSSGVVGLRGEGRHSPLRHPTARVVVRALLGVPRHLLDGVPVLQQGLAGEVQQGCRRRVATTRQHRPSPRPRRGRTASASRRMLRSSDQVGRAQHRDGHAEPVDQVAGDRPDLPAQVRRPRG